MDSLGQLVFEWRTQSDLSQAELAKLVGGKVRGQHIQQLEAIGNRTPRYLADLARAMGSSIDDLIALRMPKPLKEDAKAKALAAVDHEAPAAAETTRTPAGISEQDWADFIAAKMVLTPRQWQEIRERAEQAERAMQLKRGAA
jgi:transcriptional regulator with XRE-family HTH domain